jgi:hypothetical protein
MKKLFIILLLCLFAGVTKSYAYTDSWGVGFDGDEFPITYTYGANFYFNGTVDIVTYMNQDDCFIPSYHAMIKLWDSQSNLFTSFYFGAIYGIYDTQQTQHFEGIVDVQGIEVGTYNVTGWVGLFW